MSCRTAESGVFGTRPSRRHNRFLAPFWGHRTPEDEDAERARAKGLAVIRWTDPESDIEVKKATYYCPDRYRAEQEAADLRGAGYHNRSQLIMSYYEKVRYPYPYLTDPHFGACEKRLRHYRNLAVGQAFVRERLQALGPDLAAAHFLLHRGLSVRFVGHDHWTSLGADGRLPHYVPRSYDKGWHVEAIDASYSCLVYEGLGNLRNLLHLKSLDLSYSCYVDVWCLDRLTGEFSDTLEHLNLSGCRALDWNGLEAAWRLRRLKTLELHDMDHVRDLPLFCLNLVEANPELRIRGVDFENTRLLEGTEHEGLVDAYEQLLPGSEADVQAAPLGGS